MFGNEFSFPKSKNLVFCECSEVGLIGKLDVQKGGVFGRTINLQTDTEI